MRDKLGRFIKGHNVPKSWKRTKKKIKKNCLFCGKEFYVHNYLKYIAKFCSRKCRSSFRKGSLSPWYGKKRSLKDRIKISKGNKGTKKPWVSEMLRGKTGKEARHWKGGLKNRKKQDKRNDSAYQEWVRKIKKRDGGCMMKDKNCKGYNIVHHIFGWTRYPKLRYKLNNGITLCQYHHPRKRIDEQRLIPFFQKMIKTEVLNDKF